MGYYVGSPHLVQREINAFKVALEEGLSKELGIGYGFNMGIMPPTLFLLRYFFRSKVRL